MNHTHRVLSLILSAFFLFPATVRPEVSIPARAKIRIFWRYVPVHMNPLDIRGAFKYSGFITAAKNPSGEGAIKGKQIVSLIDKKSPDKKIIRCRALSLKEGEEPSNRPTLASITVRNDNTFYDNFVIRTTEGDLVLYVDVLVAR